MSLSFWKAFIAARENKAKLESVFKKQTGKESKNAQNHKCYSYPGTEIWTFLNRNVHWYCENKPNLEINI
jgi:hypothetical protein